MKALSAGKARTTTTRRPAPGAQPSRATPPNPGAGPFSRLSRLEKKFQWTWLAVNGELPLRREYCFAPPRKWRFDFAHPASQVGIELEGGIWTGGRHNRAQGFLEDCRKYLQASLLGWLVIRLPDALITSPNLERIAELVRRRESEFALIQKFFTNENPLGHNPGPTDPYATPDAYAPVDADRPGQA